MRLAPLADEPPVASGHRPDLALRRAELRMIVHRHETAKGAATAVTAPSPDR